MEHSTDASFYDYATNGPPRRHLTLVNHRQPTPHHPMRPFHTPWYASFFEDERATQRMVKSRVKAFRLNSSDFLKCATPHGRVGRMFLQR